VQSNTIESPCALHCEIRRGELRNVAPENGTVSAGKLERDAIVQPDIARRLSTEPVDHSGRTASRRKAGGDTFGRTVRSVAHPDTSRALGPSQGRAAHPGQFGSKLCR